jgi:hypothetical protein
MTEPVAANVLLRKAEFLYLCNYGKIRILRNRIIPEHQGILRVLATGISTSPTDADNCVVIGLNTSWETSTPHHLAHKKDIIWLETSSIERISTVKAIDEEPLRSSVDGRFSSMFVSNVEDAWLGWLAEESVTVHLDAAQKLLAWGNLKPLSKTEANSAEFTDIVAAMLGLPQSHTGEPASLTAKFFRSLPRLAKSLGPYIGTLHSPFILANAWLTLSNENTQSSDESKPRANEKFLKKLERAEISVESLISQKAVKKIRALERQQHTIFDKRTRPLLMAAVADTNYRIVGEVFMPDDFTRYLRVIREFEGTSAARVNAINAACRLGPEIISATLSGGRTNPDTTISD